MSVFSHFFKEYEVGSNLNSSADLIPSLCCCLFLLLLQFLFFFSLSPSLLDIHIWLLVGLDKQQKIKIKRCN